MNEFMNLHFNRYVIAEIKKEMKKSEKEQMGKPLGRKANN